MCHKIKNVILTLFTMVVSHAAAALEHDFVAILNIHQAQPYFEDVNNTTLILFDIDSTLTTLSDPYLRRQAIQQHKTIYNELVMPLTQNQNRIFNHLLVIESTSQLLENEWPTVIMKLQKKGCKTLALTSAKTGALGSILASFPQWRYEELKRLGIDFSSTFPGIILFKNLNDFGGEHPGMEKGIVYCGHQSKKGELLNNILKELQFTPKTIIFIDDKMENLISLSKAVQKSLSNTHFLGIHYKGMEMLPNIPTDPIIFKEKLITLVKMTRNICQD